jgi:hypothetical protein
MGTSGSVALSHVAAKASHVDVACKRCERRGRYQLAKLVAQLGPDFPMTDLGAELANCPHRREHAHNKRCDVYFPGLIEILRGGTGAA